MLMFSYVCFHSDAGYIIVFHFVVLGAVLVSPSTYYNEVAVTLFTCVAQCVSFVKNSRLPPGTLSQSPE